MSLIVAIIIIIITMINPHRTHSYSRPLFTKLAQHINTYNARIYILFVVEVLLYVHRNRRLIRDGSPGRPPRPSHSS